MSVGCSLRLVPALLRRMAVLSDCLHTLSETERAQSEAKGGGAEGLGLHRGRQRKASRGTGGKALRKAITVFNQPRPTEAQMVRNLI